MKNKNKTTAGKTAKIFGMFALACGLLFTGCAKKGDTGPAGTNGTNGKDGNANVKSKTIFINGSEWTNSVGFSTLTKLVPEITADVVNNGAVMVYIEGNTGVWSALPLTATETTGEVLAYGFDVESGKLTLTIGVNFNVTLTSAIIGDSNFKVVTIAGSGRLANPNVNYKDYNEVKKVFNLQD